MNLILLRPEEVTNHKVILTGRRCKHIYKIIKPEIGASLRVGIIDGMIGSAKVESISKKEILLLVTADKIPDSPPPVHLILALPRPIMLKRVLAQATALGVERISLINAKRVEKSFFQSTLVATEDFTPFLLNGLEQAIDTKVPTISLHKRFRPFIEDFLPSVIKNDSRNLIAHPSTACRHSQYAPLQDKQPVVIAIGPEGGWVDFEVDKFTKQGFSAFSLGSRILRVDSAVPAILAQIDLLRHI